MCTQPCLTCCNPMGYSLPGSSIYGIFQVGLLKCVAISYSRDLPDPGIKPTSLASPTLAGGFFTSAPPGKSLKFMYYESPLDSKEIKPSILKEINPEYSLERLVLKLQYFGHLIGRASSLKKSLMLKKIEVRRRGRQRIRWLGSITNPMDISLSNL